MDFAELGIIFRWHILHEAELPSVEIEIPSSDNGAGSIKELKENKVLFR